MPDALGLLESAQSAAVKIPYENIAAGQKSIGLALNAFHLAADTNMKKQQLEKEMAALQQNMFYKNQDHQLDMEKFGWQQKYQMAQLDRQDAAQRATAMYQDRMASTAEDRVGLVLGQSAMNSENASKYQDALTSWIQKYPETYANQEAVNELALVNSKFSTVAGTKEGKEVTRRFDTQVAAARATGHQNAQLIRDNLNFSLQKQGPDGLGPKDLSRPEDAFHEQDGKLMIYEKPIWASGQSGVGPIAQWDTVPPDEAKNLKPEERAAQGIRVRSSPVNSWNSIKALHEQYRKYGGQDLNDAPSQIKKYSPLPSSKEQLQSGQVYQTGRGPARWNGAAFESL